MQKTRICIRIAVTIPDLGYSQWLQESSKWSQLKVETGIVQRLRISGAVSPLSHML